MSGTALIDTFLTIVANDVAGRLLADENFAANIARAILRIDPRDKTFEALSSHVRSQIVLDENFREFVRGEAAHKIDLVMADDRFSISAEQVYDFEDAVDKRVSDAFHAEASSIEVDAGHIKDLEDAIDDRISAQVATGERFNDEVADAIERYLSAANGQRSVLKAFAAGMAMATQAPSVKDLPLNFEEAMSATEARHPEDAPTAFKCAFCGTVRTSHKPCGDINCPQGSPEANH